MYFANTWHKSFNFVITPEEFEAVFSRDDYEFVTGNTLVDMDYISTEKQEIFNAYQQYYEKILLREEKYNHKILWTIEDKMRQSMIDQTKKLIFLEVEDNKKDAVKYKEVRTKEPFMNIAPFYLLYIKEKLYMQFLFLPFQNALLFVLLRSLQH